MVEGFNFMRNSCRNQKMESSPFSRLPESVVEEIFYRLPAESLVRLKPVCRSWRALISNRSFANRHLRASIDNSKISSSATTLLVHLNYEEQPLDRRASELLAFTSNQMVLLANICSKDAGDIDSLHCVVDEPDLPLFLKTKLALSDFDSVVLVSNCNGIICTAACDSRFNEIVFYNPALKEFKCTSPPVLPRHNFTGHGFGYDSRDDEYKFVTISHTYKITRSSVPVPIEDISALLAGLTCRAQLYTLGTDSWTEIKIDIEIGSIFLCHRGMYCKDVYYWRSLPLQGSKGIVLAFDMSKEEFCTIPLPDGIQEDNVKSRWKNLALWKESVVFFNLIEESPHSTLFEMWVMVDKFGGVEGDTSWTKHISIGPLENVMNPLEFWKDDELLIETRGGGIVSYNLYTKRVRTIPIDLMVSPDGFYVEPYVNSLVSIKRENVLSR